MVLKLRLIVDIELRCDEMSEATLCLYAQDDVIPCLKHSLDNCYKPETIRNPFDSDDTREHPLETTIEVTQVKVP
jgi:hypothetical protein